MNALQRFFKQFIETTDDTTDALTHRLQLASAVLMVEVMHADGRLEASEREAIAQRLQQRYTLESDEVEALLALAEDEKHALTDYYAFTSLLNAHCQPAEKIQLLRDLWAVAYADDELDKYEEHLIRRLADLLHVPHHEFIRSKLAIQDQK